MSKNFMKSPNGSLIIVFVFLIAINFLVSQKSFYFDLTEEKLYTPSEVSRNILQDLEEPVLINFYISEDLPADYINLKLQIEDMVKQYQDLAGGNLKIIYNQPDNEEETVLELAQQGIPQLQNEFVEKDSIEVKRFFFGATISSETDESSSEVIQVIPSLESFEYSFISAVYAVSKQDKEMVAFLRGHGEKEVNVIEIEKSYDVENVLIGTDESKGGFYIEGTEPEAVSGAGGETEASEEISLDMTEDTREFIIPNTLVIAGPQTNFSEEEFSVLDDFISSGGKVVLLSEKVNPDLEQGFVSKNIETNISDFAKTYGIEIEDNLLYDKNNSNITYTKQTYFGMQYATNPYPFWPILLEENFGDHPALSKIQTLALFWASSLKTEDVDGYEIETLFTSSSNSNTISDNIDITPEQDLLYKKGDKKILGAISSSLENSGELIVIGDSDFISPNFMQSVSDNEIFFLNLIDSISSEVNLSSIRSKNISSRAIEELTDKERNYWKFFSIFGGAILLGVYGFIRINKRKKKSKS